MTWERARQLHARTADCSVHLKISPMLCKHEGSRSVVQLHFYRNYYPNQICDCITMLGYWITGPTNRAVALSSRSRRERSTGRQLQTAAGKAGSNAHSLLAPQLEHSRSIIRVPFRLLPAQDCCQTMRVQRLALAAATWRPGRPKTSPAPPPSLAHPCQHPAA